MSIHLKGLKPGDLGELTIVVGDPGRVALLGTLLEDTRLITDTREFQVLAGKYKGAPVSICSTGIGLGSTEIAITELIENDVKKIVRCGGCGAWQDNINVGDMILNSGMARNPGLLSTYVPDSYPAVADPELLTQIKESLEEDGLVTHTGVGLTSETYYAGQWRMPSIDKAPNFASENGMKYYQDRNVLNCEMETAILYILGSLYGIPVANSLVVHVTRRNDSWADDEAYRARHLMSGEAVLKLAL